MDDISSNLALNVRQLRSARQLSQAQLARIAGINIPSQKRLAIALTYIYGIGPHRAQEICTTCGIPLTTRVHELSTDQVNTIREVIDRDYS